MDDNNFLKVENSSLTRDIRSRAVINTNDKERQLYLARKTALQLKDQKIGSLEERVCRLEEEIEILRKLIQQ